MPTPWESFLASLEPHGASLWDSSLSATEEEEDLAAKILRLDREEREREREQGRRNLEERTRRLAEGGALPAAEAEVARDVSTAEMIGRSALAGGVGQLGLAIGDVGAIAIDKMLPDDSAAQRGFDRAGRSVREILGLGPEGTMSQAADEAARSARADYMATRGDSAPLGVAGTMAGVEFLSGLGAAKLTGKALGIGAGKLTARQLLAERGIDMATGGAVNAAMAHREGESLTDTAGHAATGAVAALVIGEGFRAAASGATKLAQKRRAAAEARPTEELAILGAEEPSLDRAARAEQIAEAIRAHEQAHPAEGSLVEYGKWEDRYVKLLDDAKAIEAEARAAAELGALGVEGPELAAAREVAERVSRTADDLGGIENLGLLSDRLAAQGVQVEPYVGDAAALRFAADEFVQSPIELSESAAKATSKVLMGAQATPAEAELAMAQGIADVVRATVDPSLTLRGVLMDPALVRGKLGAMIRSSVKGETDAVLYGLESSGRAFEKAVADYAKSTGDPDIGKLLYERTQYGPAKAVAAITREARDVLKAQGSHQNDAQTNAAIKQAWQAMMEGNDQALSQMDPNVVEALRASYTKWGIPEEIMPAWRGLMQTYDGMRKAMIGEGIADEATAKEIAAKGWAYMHRRYSVAEGPEEQLARVKGSPEWERELSKLKRRMGKMAGEEPSDSEVKGALEALILGDKLPARFVGNSKAVKRSAKELISRKNLSPDFRKLLGEKMDLEKEWAVTGRVMAESLARHRTMRRVRDLALEVGAANPKRVEGLRPVDLADPRAGETNPAGDVYWRGDIAEVLNGLPQVFDNTVSFKRAFLDRWTEALSIGRSAKIVSNVASMANKFIGETASFITAGAPQLLFQPRNAARSITAALASGIEDAARVSSRMSPDAMDRLAVGLSGGSIKPGEFAKLHADAIRHGAVHGSVVSELASLHRYGGRKSPVPKAPAIDGAGRSIESGLSAGGAVVQRVAGGALKAWDRGTEPLRKVVDAANKLPNAYSTVLRTTLYHFRVNEQQAALAKALSKAGVARPDVERAVAAAAAEHRQIAGEEVSQIMPSWDRAPEWAKAWDRKSPLFPWATAVVEPLRNTVNQVKLAANSLKRAGELASSVSNLTEGQKAAVTSSLVSDAAKRMGSIAAGGAFLMWLAQSNTDAVMDPEQQDAARDLLAMDFELPQRMSIVGYEPGKSVAVRNYGTTDPAEMLWRVARSMTTGGPAEALTMMLHEAASFEPTAKVIAESVTGRSVADDALKALGGEGGGRPIRDLPPRKDAGFFESLETRGRQALQTADRAAYNLLGGTARRAIPAHGQVSRWGKEGSRDIREAVYYKARDLDQTVKSLVDEYRRRAAGTADQTKLLALQEDIDERWAEARATMQRHVHSARLLELDEKELRHVLGLGGSQKGRALQRLRKKGKVSLLDPLDETGFWDIYDPVKLLETED